VGRLSFHTTYPRRARRSSGSAGGESSARGAGDQSPSGEPAALVDRRAEPRGARARREDGRALRRRRVEYVATTRGRIHAVEIHRGPRRPSRTIRLRGDALRVRAVDLA